MALGLCVPKSEGLRSTRLGVIVIIERVTREVLPVLKKKAAFRCRLLPSHIGLRVGIISIDSSGSCPSCNRCYQAFTYGAKESPIIKSCRAPRACRRHKFAARICLGIPLGRADPGLRNNSSTRLFKLHPNS